MAEEVHDWSAHYDDDGQVFYYNNVTEETSWDPPADGKFNPPPEKKGSTDEAAEEDEYEWTAHMDEEEGREYYYNEKTGETSWDPPADGKYKPIEANEESADKDNDKAEEEDEYEWTAHMDEEEGREYYYNEKTGETSWDPPADGKYKPVEANEESGDTEPATENNEDEEEEEKEPTSPKSPPNNESSETVEAVESAAQPSQEEEYEWTTHMDEEEGREYYYNTKTGETSWEPPADGKFKPAEAAETAAAQATKSDSDSKTTYEWSAFKDDEGREYYYNATTGETSWDPPEDGKFNPIEASDQQEEEDDKFPSSPQHEKADDDSDATPVQNEPGAEPEVEATAEAEWVAYKDEEGNEYYYNASTGETQWEKPDGIKVVAAEDLEKEADKESEQAMPADEAQPMDVDAQQPSEPQEEAPKSPEPEPEPEIDPEVKRVRDAEAALSKTDSILEPSCISNVAEVVRSEGGNPQKAINALIDNYHGQTAVCGLLGRWLADIRKPAAGVAASSASDESTDQVRDVVQGVLSRFVKESFSKKTGDRILNLSKAEVSFLEEMMDSSRWRKLLIDLSAIHKDSAVLIYCLRAISKRGHHREIAKRVNQSDHFAVFNAMLQSELANVGAVAISAESDVASSIGLEELLNDLKRACCSTSYTYVYTMELLKSLELRAKQFLEANPSHERFRRAIHKWHALAESLETAMVDPSSSTSIGGSSTLFRKRRLDVALTTSELHQRQRRRRLASAMDDDDHHESSSDERTKKTLETALLNFLRRHSVGMQLNDAALDPLLPTGIDLTSFATTGRLLIEHPLAIRALLDHLFKPGSTRVVAPVLRNKCARLLAFAVLAAETSVQTERNVSQSSDEVSLTRMIVQASQLCEQLETMVSFLVIVESNSGKTPTSPGEKLCSLALQCAAIGQGVVIWAETFSHGVEFANSPAFPTISASILSLLRIVSRRYPSTRSDAIRAAVNFLGHSNSDISYQTLTAIKEQSLRLLIMLLLHGDNVPLVLDSLSQKPSMDASLVRYFVGGLLECLAPPVSAECVRCLGRFLQQAKCVDALHTKYFTEANQAQLKELLRSFATAAVPDDQKLVSSLWSAYQMEAK